MNDPIVSTDVLTTEVKDVVPSKHARERLESETGSDMIAGSAALDALVLRVCDHLRGPAELVAIEVPVLRAVLHDAVQPGLGELRENRIDRRARRDAEPAGVRVEDRAAGRDLHRP